MSQAPRSAARVAQVLRELGEDMDAIVEWHYTDVADGYRTKLNGCLEGLRTLIGASEVPEDFSFSDRDLSTTGKTVREPAFERLRRAVRSATEIAQREVSAAEPGRDPPPWTTTLHPLIQAAAAGLATDGHGSQSILEAFKAVIARVKTLAGVDQDGKSLMAAAFSEEHPLVRLNEGQSRSDRDEQEGFKFIFMGAVQGIRNPKAHDIVINVDPERVAEYLALASLLMRRLDDAEALREVGGS